MRIAVPAAGHRLLILVPSLIASHYAEAGLYNNIGLARNWHFAPVACVVLAVAAEAKR